jgi:hypothetical protein
MNRTLITIISILFLILLINIPPIKFIFGSDDCQYSNAGGSFTYDEMSFNERDFAMGMRRFHDFKVMHPGDTVLYRLCSMNPLYIWKYGDYLFSTKYRLPYKSWKEIDIVRGTIHHRTNFQDF